MNVGIFRENSIGLLILAGGKSLRMGRDKSTLTIGKKTFVEHISWQMGTYAEKILSVGPDCKTEESCGIKILTDKQEFSAMGPGAGIVTALESCESQWLMTVPCDTPYVDEALALKLWEASKNLESPAPILAVGTKGVEPLIALYPKAVASLMRERLLAGTKKVLDLIEGTGYVTVQIDDEKLLNINCPEDYRALKENLNE